MTHTQGAWPRAQTTTWAPQMCQFPLLSLLDQPPFLPGLPPTVQLRPPPTSLPSASWAAGSPHLQPFSPGTCPQITISTVLEPTTHIFSLVTTKAAQAVKWAVFTLEEGPKYLSNSVPAVIHSFTHSFLHLRTHSLTNTQSGPGVVLALGVTVVPTF